MVLPEEKKELFQKIPSVDRLLNSPAVGELLLQYPRRVVLKAVHQVLEGIRNAIKSGQGFDEPLSLETVSHRVSERAASLDRPSLKPVINATGIVVHTNLGRSILAERVLKKFKPLAGGYSNLEYDLQKGERGSRYVHVEELLKDITGAEAGTVVNNNAAAVFLALHELAAGGAGSFDVANYHDYNSWWTLPRHYDMCRAVLDAHGLTHTPIWVTETGISSRTNTSITPRYSSPDAQAADVWRRFALLYGKGAQLVAWHNHYSANLPGGTGFDQFGLLDHTGKKKKSWHAMKLLIQKLEGFQTAQLLATGLINDDNLSGGAGAWAVRFRCADGAHRYVLWSPDNQNHTLTGLTARTYQTLRVVPATLSPDGQTATFLTNTVTPAAGQYTFALEDAPILVEPVPPPPFALRGELDVSGAPVLVWSAEVGEVITVEVAATLLPANWTPVPAGDLEFSIVGTEKRARYVGPLSPPLFFRLRWSAP